MKLNKILLALGLMAGAAGVHASEPSLQVSSSGGTVSVVGGTSTHASEPSHHWEYEGENGPEHWGDLSHEFETCKTGKEQSPIDIRTAKVGHLEPIGFNYTASAAEIVNNGHTVQVNLADGGTVHLRDGEYKLLQFHFHTPSEERINGKRYPLVAHLVHKNAHGDLAVVAVLFKAGRENAALKQVFASLPAEAGEKHALEGGINLEAVLPEHRGYYAYKGSLTTPPCSEGVRWQVLKHTVQISPQQLYAFKQRYSMNARPVQPLNGRTVEVVE